MLAVNGYYDGNICVLEEPVSEKPQKVIITFLNKAYEGAEMKTIAENTKAEKLRALQEMQDIWKGHDDSVPVDEYVRNMRKGRQFDIL